VLLEIPGPGVDEGGDSNPKRVPTLATLFPPLRLETVTTGKEPGPELALEVGDQDNESTRYGDAGWFELPRASGTGRVNIGGSMAGLNSRCISGT
jgi:hypothetical protein